MPPECRSEQASRQQQQQQQRHSKSCSMPCAAHIGHPDVRITHNYTYDCVHNGAQAPTSAALMNPLPSLSNTLKASISSASLSVSCRQGRQQ